MNTKYRSLSVLVFLVLVFFALIQCDNANKNYLSFNSNSLRLGTPENSSDNTGAFAQRTKEDLLPEKTISYPAEAEYLPGNIKTGRIGKSDFEPTDSPRDNVFSIDVKDHFKSNAEVWLEYELYGVLDHNSVGMGINDNLSYGGLVVKKNHSWTHQKERVNVADLKKGKNIIRFSNESDIPYQVKNLRLKIKNNVAGTKGERKLVINQPLQSYFYEGYGFLKGFVQGKGAEKAKVFFNNKQVQLNNGSFEGLAACLVGGSGEETVEVVAKFEDGQTLSSNIVFNKLDVADYLSIPAQNKYLRESQQVSINQNIDLSLNDFSLQGEAGAVSYKKELSVTTLRSMDMPTMDAGMLNVTGQHKGYRLLPHGSTFNSALRIGVPYDTTQLPVGYKPSDIRSYFFNENTNSWTELPYDSVDEEQCIVYSYTTHFTDFINGILKVPDAPQTNAYTPTSLKEMKAANPVAGINMIQPPSANSQGTVNTGMPIEIPSGRNGLAPQLALNYSSDGGSGWVGTGWNISLPSIDVETRWGVPRYNTNLETESYLMSGSQLTPMVRGSQFVSRSNGSKRFYERIKGSYNKIIRYGDNPKNYYWVVTDRNGVKYYYGVYSDPTKHDSLLSVDTVNTNLVLASKYGQIASWKLAEIRDPYGNFVKYKYQKVFHSGVSGTETGRQIYPLEITYTGFGTTEGKYKVEFDIIQDSIAYERKDISVSARKRFKEVSANLLRKIKVSYNGQFIRQYHIKYRKGAFSKTLVCSLIEIVDPTKISTVENVKDSAFCDCEDYKMSNKGIRVHEFSYYDQDDNGFTSATAISTNKDSESLDLLEDMVTIPAEYTLGQNSTTGWNIGGGLNIGGGANTMLKSLSLGGSYTYSHSKSEITLTLMDINGDGLVDKVFRVPGTNTIMYRPLEKTASGYAFSAQADTIEELCLLGRTRSNTHNIGLEGHVLIANASRSWNYTDGYTDAYFCDVNADGLPDFIDNEKVYINQLDASGEPEFVLESTTTDTMYVGGSCNYLLRTNGVDESVYTPDGDNPIIYKRDAVRMWKAPYTGYIKIEAPIQLIEDTSYNRQISRNADGIGWSIQHEGGIIAYDTINASDYIVHDYTSGAIQVSAGHQFYFRLESYDYRTFDKVKWNPKIYYTNQYGTADTSVFYVDANGKNAKVFDAKKDFLLNDKQEFVAPFQGKLMIRGTIQTPALSDSLHIMVKKNSSTILSNILVDNTSHNYYLFDTISVVEGDRIRFIGKTTTNIDFSAVDVDVRMYYYDSDSITIDTNSTTNHVEVRPMIEYEIFQQSLFHSMQYPITSSGSYTFTPTVLNIASTSSGSITFAVKKEHDILGEKTLTVTNGAVTGSGNNITVSLSAGDKINIEFYSKDVEFTSSPYPYASDGSTQYMGGLHVTMPDSMWKFGNLYRGWGQFSYKGTQFQKSPLTFYAINQPNLILTDLARDTSLIQMDTSNFNNIDSITAELQVGGLNDPVDYYFSPMYADLDSMVWRDFAKYSYFSKEVVSNQHLYPSYDTIYDSPLISVETTTSPITIKTVRKHTYDDGDATGASVNIGITLGKSWNSSISKGQLDYFDMNGDRYPDIVGTSKVQYTNPSGGFYSTADYLYNYSGYQEASSSGTGTSAGVNLPVNKGSSSTTVNVYTSSENSGVVSVDVKIEKDAPAISGGANSFTSNSNSDVSLIDINGDGLPDLFNRTTGKVRLNYGYDFAPNEEDWNLDNINTSLSTGYGGSVGIGGTGFLKPTTTSALGTVKEFNKLDYSWSGGVNLGSSLNESSLTLTDMNGDGLIDIIYINPSDNNLYVYFNSGTGFGSNEQWNQAVDIQQSKSVNASGYLAGSLGFTVFGAAKVVINPNGGISASKTFENARLMDFDGDGYMDIVTTSGSGYDVYFSKLGKVNLLKEVISPLDTSFVVDYEMTNSTQDCPSRRWVMKQVSTFDGHSGDGYDSLIYVFEYKNPYYDRFERSFYGFDTVITKQKYSLTANTDYRTTTQVFINDDFYYKGKLLSELLTDSLGDKLTKTVNIYTATTCDGPVTYDFPALLAIENYFYEGNATAQMQTRQEFTYDDFANIILVNDKRDVAITTDDVQSIISYKIDTVVNFLSLPDTIDVKQGATLLRKRTASYNMTYGSLSSLTLHNTSSTSSYSFNYDSYGNMDRITMPENYNGQAMYYEYSYDPVIHTLPISVNDAFEYFSETAYDYRLQAPVYTKDMTGNEMEFTYYQDGALKTVRGPNEIASQAPYSIKFEYFSQHNPVWGATPWARTTYYDPLNQGNEFFNIMFADGMGRIIQTKTKSVIYNPATGQDDLMITVSGKNVIDPYGRVVKTYYPDAYTYAYDSLLYTSSSQTIHTKIYYDAMDRKTHIHMPDNTHNYMAYGFGNDAFGVKQFRQTTIDALGAKFHSYINAFGKQTTLQAPLSTLTKFAYNPLGELTQSTDPQGSNTSYSYDMMGQLLSRDHPDAGVTSYSYDNAGNLMTLQTANLAGQGVEIQYQYDYNRLSVIDYPVSIGNDVFYEYGGIDQQTGIPDNQTGRLIKTQDASGVQTFKYGNMGELIENVHTFIVPGGDPYTFKTKWSYDSWNRIDSIYYPDGEQVVYGYNDAGALTSLSGTKGSQSFDYVDSIRYDKFGSRVRLRYGNGTATQYSYDSLSRRMTNLKSWDGNDSLMQNINYYYYANGNISGTQNSANSIGTMGGNELYYYSYDSLSRLIWSMGGFTDYNSTNYNYQLEMQYSAAGNITQKTLTGTTLLSGVVSNVSYTNNYQYGGSQPHAVSTIKDASNNPTHYMNWDANGNMTQLSIPYQGMSRSMCWDEENRLTVVRDPEQFSHYIYDAGGERVWKLTEAVERMTINGEDYIDQASLDKTLYTSPYMILTEREYTKHYFIESQRVTTKLGGGMDNNLVDPFNGTLSALEGDVTTIAQDLYDNLMQTSCNERMNIDINTRFEIMDELIQMDNDERDLYFYHGDHLGSSSWITNGNGIADQYLAYMPFGEDFINERNSNDIRFKFTGKERDAETGFDYFGARYYNSDLSIWLSVDPLADKYPSNSVYMYCVGNPVVLVDPDGRKFVNFDEDGNYTGTTKDNRWHNFWHGSKGRVLNSDGDVVQKFKFADPENDVADIESGRINKLIFVKQSEIENMLFDAGAFDYDNKCYNKDISERYDFISEESPGGGEFDFSITKIPYQYSDENVSQSLFLIDGVAHNHFNFGNFLWGAGGKSLGLTLPELKAGAHWRALTQNGEDGYPNQFDSRDDQYSIRQGVRYARQRNYKNKWYRITFGPLTPLKK